MATDRAGKMVACSMVVGRQGTRNGSDRNPQGNRKLTILASTTFKNVAAPHCSDEREVNSQKPDGGGGTLARF
jgi:hypothetical protein